MRAFAEWEAQSALLVSLPHAQTDWAPYLGEIERAYTAFVRAVAHYQPVVAIAPSAEIFERICGEINERFAVSFAQIPTNDTWIRDYGAIDVENDGACGGDGNCMCDDDGVNSACNDDSANGTQNSTTHATQNDTANNTHGTDDANITALNFTFNAWGGKFASDKDDALNAKLYEIWGKPLKNVDLILEGGSVDFDGVGVMLTTAECLLNDNRNNLGKDELDARLKEIFGLREIIWLEHGFIRGDDTDSHVDTLARFLDARTIAVATCDDKSDVHFAELSALKDEILSHGYDVVELPIPHAVMYEGRRLPATYANFVFINGALIVPTYADPADQRDPNHTYDELALSRLRAHFPSLDVVGVDARVFIRQNGSLHCSCMNKYKGKK